MIWRKGAVYTRSFDCGVRLIEIRDDICEGWCWALQHGVVSRTFGEAKTLAAAKRAAMREAKRLGWLK